MVLLLLQFLLIVAQLGNFAQAAPISTAPISVAPIMIKSDCKALAKLQNLVSIHDQFQLIQLGQTNALTELQEKEIAKIFKNNPMITSQLICYADYSEVSNQDEKLSTFLTVLKLQIIEIRVAAIKNQKDKLENGLTRLREVQNKLVLGNTSMERRLAATVRSMLLDELEKAGSENETIIKNQLQQMSFLGRPGDVIQSNINAKIKFQIEKFGQNIRDEKTAEKLSNELSKVKWEAPSLAKNALSKIIGHFENHPMDLKGQLDELFVNAITENKKAVDAILDLANSQNVLQYYAKAVATELQKSPYLSVKDWLEPVVQARMKSLKDDLGFAWPLIEGLGGVTLEGKFSSIKKPIEILDSVRFKKAKVSFAKTKNPIGRLFEIVILREAQQEWTDVDVSQLKTDLNRSGLLTTSLAIYDYRASNKRAPASIEDLVKSKVLSVAPKDYFTGEPFHYSAEREKIWSVGENRKDEQGDGDDISISLKK